MSNDNDDGRGTFPCFRFQAVEQIPINSLLLKLFKTSGWQISASQNGQFTVEKQILGRPQYILSQVKKLNTEAVKESWKAETPDATIV